MDQKQTQPRRANTRGLWVSIGLLAGLVVGAAIMWWAAAAYHDRSRIETMAHLRDQLLKVQADRDELYAHRDVLKGELAVESSTRKGLEMALDTAQTELGAARDQIAFFYELMPAGPEGSISIRGLDFQVKGSMLQFRVLLMRDGASDDPFDGMLQFQASGRAAGEAVTVTLEPVRVATPDSAVKGTVNTEPPVGAHVVAGDAANGVGNDDDAVDASAPEGEANSQSSPTLSLRFEQFQRSSGLLQIPEGVELEEVTLNVLEGETLRVSRTVSMPAQQLPH